MCHGATRHGSVQRANTPTAQPSNSLPQRLNPTPNPTVQSNGRITRANPITPTVRSNGPVQRSNPTVQSNGSIQSFNPTGPMQRSYPAVERSNPTAQSGVGVRGRKITTAIYSLYRSHFGRDSSPRTSRGWSPLRLQRRHRRRR